MMDAAHETTCDTEIRAEERTYGVGTLFGLHCFIASQIALILNLWEAIIYTIMPLVLFSNAFELVYSAPLFALLCIAPAMLSFGGIRRILRLAETRLSPLKCALIWIALSLWLPVICGEGLRQALMEPVLRNTPAQCRGSIDLFESMQRKLSSYGLRQPHAWVIRDGQPWLWSYRSLRFEPAPDWSGAPPSSKDCTVFHKTGTDR